MQFESNSNTHSHQTPQFSLKRTMSKTLPQPNHDPIFKNIFPLPFQLKFNYLFQFPPIKITNIFTIFMKGFLAICFLASISFITYSAFSSHSRWLLTCPDCPTHPQPLLHYSTNDFSGEPPTNISHILFGIGGSAKTWNDRRHYSELWWNPNLTRGYVWLEEKPNITWHDTSPPYKVSADTTRFKYTSWYGSRSAIRIARIVKESFELGLDNVRWFVMGDDDTVFFKENLLTVLGKYDHNQMYYVGGNSESVEQDVIHSYTMAYGGGGFAISYPLAAELVRVLDGCIDRYASFYGSDQKVQGCMSEIGVPVTKELGFHQVDIRGNPYGLLAAHPLAPLVSLHHLDYVEPIFPGLNRSDSLTKLVQSYKSDPGRTLQHSFCYDLIRNWSISVSWGYAVQLHPTLVTAKLLETPIHTFVTWRSWSQEPFTFNTRDLSPDPCNNPLVYFVDRVEEDGETGRTLSRYNRTVVEPGRKECDKENYEPALSLRYVNVTAAKFEADMWKKAPRRQCCEIMNGGDDMEGVLLVQIRSCQHYESVTPP